MRLLAANGADVNLHGAGETALVAASRTGQLDVVQFLVANGAYGDHGTALFVAFKTGHIKVVEFLLVHGAARAFPRWPTSAK